MFVKRLSEIESLVLWGRVFSGWKFGIRYPVAQRLIFVGKGSPLKLSRQRMPQSFTNRNVLGIQGHGRTLYIFPQQLGPCWVPCEEPKGCSLGRRMNQTTGILAAVSKLRTF